jgi:hypothetical protein
MLSAHAHDQFRSEKKDHSCSICQLSPSTLKFLVSPPLTKVKLNRFFTLLKVQESSITNTDLSFSTIIRGPPAIFS